MINLIWVLILRIGKLESEYQKILEILSEQFFFQLINDKNIDSQSEYIRI